MLVHWQGEPAASATWKDIKSIIDRYPSFKLEDELLGEGEGGEMSCGADNSLEHEVQLGLPPREQASKSQRWFRWLFVSALKRLELMQELEPRSLPTPICIQDSIE